jgi:hypothetical protein
MRQCKDSNLFNLTIESESNLMCAIFCTKVAISLMLGYIVVYRLVLCLQRMTVFVQTNYFNLPRIQTDL